MHSRFQMNGVQRTQRAIDTMHDHPDKMIPERSGKDGLKSFFEYNYFLLYSLAGVHSRFQMNGSNKISKLLQPNL